MTLVPICNLQIRFREPSLADSTNSRRPRPFLDISKTDLWVCARCAFGSLLCTLQSYSVQTLVDDHVGFA
jgi:hypothetical protein